MWFDGFLIFILSARELISHVSKATDSTHIL